jgi:hypothetical protein
MKTKRIVQLGIVMGGVLLLGVLAAGCGNRTTRIENIPAAETHGITVNGEGKVTGKPDIAQLTLGVSKLANTVEQARNDAAASLDAMIKSIRDNGVAKDDIQTLQFNISPEYDYSNGRQLLKGFRVTNVVSAKLRDINKTSKVVDDAVTAGGDNTQELQAQAREKAVADAKARAQTLAGAAGVTIGDPITISETSFQPVPLASKAFAEDRGAGAAPATPIEPGKLDVTVTVNVTWGIR